jgi:hypothetical protein
MGFRKFAAAALIGLLSLPAIAQSPASDLPPPPDSFRRVRGAVDHLDGQSLTVKSESGAIVAITLAPDVRIITSSKSSLAAIGAGDFVGSAAVKGPDGRLHAKEVHIMPGALRGVGEGQRPMAEPDTSMTNATITAIDGAATVSGGRTLKLKYPEGVAEIDVGPDVPVVMMQAADVAALKPGTPVSVGAAVTDTGLLARFIMVGDPG